MSHILYATTEKDIADFIVKRTSANYSYRVELRLPLTADSQTEFVFLSEEPNTFFKEAVIPTVVTDYWVHRLNSPLAVLETPYHGQLARAISLTKKYHLYIYDSPSAVQPSIVTEFKDARECARAMQKISPTWHDYQTTHKDW